MIRLALTLALFFLLTLAAAWQGWAGLCLKREVSPVELANLFVGVFIAFYLQSYVTAQVSDFRAEKDLLIEHTRDVLTALKGCREYFLSCYESKKLTQTDKRSILGLLRTLANNLDLLGTAIEVSKCKKLSDECKQTKNCYLDYKAAVTGGAFPARPYTVNSQSEHEKTYRELHVALQNLVFRINSFR